MCSLSSTLALSSLSQSSTPATPALSHRSKKALVMGALASAALMVAYKAYKACQQRSSKIPGNLQFTKYEADKIRHFRQYSDILASSDPKVNKTGIKNLHLSGSGQFGTEQIRSIVKKILAGQTNERAPEIWFLDFRAERHCFVNSKPAVWKTESEKVGETSQEVVADENRLIAQIADKRFVSIKERKGANIQLPNARVESEQAFIKATKHFHYMRFPMVEHHRPTDLCVNDIVEFLVNHPHASLHMHCYVTARSTLVLAMADMLHNAKEVSFEDIIYRAQAIGGSDLTKVPKPTSKKYLPTLERIEFLKNFYRYCREENPQSNPRAKTWLTWINPTI